MEGGKKCAKELKKFKTEFFNATSSVDLPKGNSKAWYIPQIYFTNFLLSPTLAQTLSILDKTGMKYSYSDIQYKYIQEKTGIKRRAKTQQEIKALEDMGLVYIIRFNKTFPNRRHYITHANSHAYCKFLISINQLDELKKFQDEFMSKTSISMTNQAPLSRLHCRVRRI